MEKVVLAVLTKKVPALSRSSYALLCLYPDAAFSASITPSSSVLEGISDIEAP